LVAGVAATTTREVVPQWEAGPAGRHVRDGGDTLLLAGVPVYIVEAPLEMSGETWVRAYVLYNPSSWPQDFYAWFPGSALTAAAPAECQKQIGFSVQQLAAVSPPDRLRCWGGQEITLEAKTWFQRSQEAYEVDPAWYGNSSDRFARISLVDPADGSPRGPSEWAWMDAQLGPDVPAPPLDFLLRVTGHFDDSTAATCRRQARRPPDASASDPPDGLPDESAADSQAWCRQQFVLTSWSTLAGPEGRPIEAGIVQLHRWLPLSTSCAGVGMGPLTFRMDQARLDPIWLESDGVALPTIVPVFDPGFRVVTAPELEILGPRGEVVARDGTVVDPDGTLSGYGICPTGQTVLFGP
jgi:hypothetical protein